MGYYFIISWILGIVLAIFFTTMAWITKDKEAWNASPYVFLVMIFTGYLTTIPILCAILLTSLNKRFK